MPKILTGQTARETTDTGAVITATSPETGAIEVLVTLITPGDGSSGHYPAEVLAQAAENKVFPRGTQMHINHDSEIQRMERPEGDLRNLAGVLLEDAYATEDGSLKARARVVSAWAPMISEIHEFIGTSIVAPADIRVEESGQRVVQELKPHKLNRVDFVTIPGRGGGIDEVYESIAGRALAMESWNSNTAAFLRDAVAARYNHATLPGGAYVVDYDDQRVIIERWHPELERDRYYSLAYEIIGSQITLSTEEIEVRRRVEYDPANSPAVPAGVTESAKLSEEEKMAKVEIDEAELSTLRESASRVTELENELKTEREARAAEAHAERVKAAEAIVAEAFGEEVPKVFARAAESAAKAEDFDAKIFREEIQEAAAFRSAESGAGRPRGLGKPAEDGELISESYTPEGKTRPSLSDALKGNL